MQKFIDFRIQFQLVPVWPAPEVHIIMFISYLSSENFAPSTINSHVSALSFVHNINGWDNPTDSFLIKKLKEGCRRVNHRVDSRLPITPSLLSKLVKILPVICKSSYEVQLFTAAFLLAFFGFLRVGEFASTDRSGTNDFKLIARDDIAVSGSCLSLRIRYSKTDQRGVQSWLRIEGSSTPHLCPVLAVTNFLESRPQGSGPLFIHFNRQVLSSYQFSFVLKEGIKQIGLSPASFSSHSFRIGAATTAAMSGFSEELIKTYGRWKSSAFQVYIRPNMISMFE